MHEDNIEHLYKFRSVSDLAIEYVERILTKNELYFPRPSEFNDPFDCLPVMSMDAPDKELLNYMEGLYKRFSPNMLRCDRKAKAKSDLKNHLKNHSSTEAQTNLDQNLKKITESVGILSLAQHPDHVLMWAHYADSHRGLCLRFKASSSTPFFGYAQKVTYQDERPKVNLIKDSPHEQVDKALLTKAGFWSYENEWRVIEHDKGPGVHCFPPKLLDGIIFGIRMPQQSRKQIVELALKRSDPVQLFEAKISSNVFGLEIYEI